jgi:DNA-binding response OmpR family regulator
LKLLIIEDELALSGSIEKYFTGDGSICETCPDLQSAMCKIDLYDYDCIILDLSLPDGNGLKILQHLKSVGKDDGVVIISAKNSLDDRIHGLNLGADDYVVKPFHLAELKARIIAIHRRKSYNGSSKIEYQNIVIDLNAMEVQAGGKLIVLTRKEYDMLLYFIANKGRVVTKNALAEHLWKDNIDQADSFDFIYTHIKNLRRKIQECTGKDFFKSIYGIGYKFA